MIAKELLVERKLNAVFKMDLSFSVGV